jgi:hypothetical protein
MPDCNRRSVDTEFCDVHAWWGWPFDKFKNALTNMNDKRPTR